MYNYAVLGHEVAQPGDSSKRRKQVKALVPGWDDRPGTSAAAVITFIIRRLIATVFLLIVVSMITFAIFFLIPRLAGQTSYQLAIQYVGRNPTRAAVLSHRRAARPERAASTCSTAGS